jgi:hypothetical protein
MRFAAALAVLLIPLARADAQEAASLIPADLDWAKPEAPSPPEYHVGRASLDVLVGLPLGLRFQMPLTSRPEGTAWLVEASAGLFFIFPTTELGLRRQWALWCGSENQVVVAPGAGVYATYNPFHHGDLFFGGGPPWWVTPFVDVDLVWQRQSGLLGVKLGVAAGDRVGFPLAGIFGGWQF